MANGRYPELSHQPQHLLSRLVASRRHLLIALGICILFFVTLYQLQGRPTEQTNDLDLSIPQEIPEWVEEPSKPPSNEAPAAPPPSQPPPNTEAPPAAPPDTEASPAKPPSTEAPPSAPPKTSAPLFLPVEYKPVSTESSYCAARYGVEYLKDLSQSVSGYCDETSKTKLNCFHSKTAKGRTDSFCIGSLATFDTVTTKFSFDCKLKPFTAEEAKNVPQLSQFPSYWYQTGPRMIFDKYISLEGGNDDQVSKQKPKDTVILISREEHTENVWHTLMEIMSLSMSLDVLRITNDPASNTPFLSDDDMSNTQVLILDERPDGPFYELWNMFSAKPVLKVKDLPPSNFKSTARVVVPLPGGSNPVWQGDWDAHSCRSSPTIEAFTRRVLSFYDIPALAPNLDTDAKLTVTFIDRKGQRQLLEKKTLITKLREAFPAVEINVVDLATYSFKEQLEIIRKTDILAGVHGAGLTHAMFLPRSATLVEILPPDFNHKGFRNLAKILNLKYYKAHAVAADPTIKSNWQTDNVKIEEDRFLKLMGTAILGMYNRGLVDMDIV